MTEYFIGIDTGGTYTDAVLMEFGSNKVLHWTKKPTTHHDLSIGVGQALESLFKQKIKPEQISGLAVSTTLATNAVVEGRGARVGLFVLGYVRHFKLPVVANIFLKGGHDIMGKEEEPLDLDGLIDTIQGLKNEVDSYAVCGAMSIQNPTHELVAEEAISIIDPKPVFCSHQVSRHAGMQERAATACLHAKLMPLMVDFLSSIQRSMLQVGLSCPVTIICGNGKGASLDEAVDRAAITMASGPAATARFGSTAGKQTALIVDVGGTTTDICMIKDARPVMNENGCRIGRWQTHVEAVDMYTAGGGGDSHVTCRPDGSITLATTRVQPLAMTPDLPDPRKWLGYGLQNAFVFLAPGLFDAQVAEDPLLTFLKQHGPATPEILARETKVSGIALEKRLERLVFLQQITMTGFTPTDALHVVSGLELGDKDLARAGAEAFADLLDTDPEALCRQVIRATEEAIETMILDYLSGTVWGGQKATPFLDKRDNELFSLSFSLKLPIIGIGAAARYFLPGVAEKLATTVSFPKYYEVGNAIGAALIGNHDQCSHNLPGRKSNPD